MIEVTDERVEIEALKTTLQSIYSSYKNVKLTGDSALAVLYIGYFIALSSSFFSVFLFLLIPAMKYMIKPLESLCVDYLLNNINAANVFTILQFAFDCATADAQLMDQCKKFLQSKTELALQAECFPNISHNCLTFLLKQSILNTSELHLFEAVCFF